MLPCWVKGDIVLGLAGLIDARPPVPPIPTRWEPPHFRLSSN